MNRFFSIFFSFFLSVIFITGCSSSGETGIIRYDMTGSVISVDPQTASEENSFLVISNIYEGLTAASPDGDIIGGSAERWVISEDELTLTFYLKEDLKWSDGSALIAEDFVFGLQRLVDPITNSPFGAKYYSIKNAKEIHSGISPINTLGVYAPDEKTVVIELVQKDPRILSLLSESSAMPCDEEFFYDQKGKYGLSAKNTLSNANLTMSSWNSEIITVIPNEHHRTPAQFNKLYFCFNRGEATDLFLDGRSEVAIIPYQRIDSAKGLKGIPILSQSWFLSINPNSFIASDKVLRESFIGAINYETMVTRLPSNVYQSQGLIPPIATISGQSYRNIVGPVDRKTTNNPRALFSSTLISLGVDSIPKTTLYVSSFEPGPLLGGVFQKEWNTTLSAHINMEQLSYDRILSKHANQSYDMAILPTVAYGTHPENFLFPFSKHVIDVNGEETTVGKELTKISSESDPTVAAKGYKKIEQALIDSSYVLPLYDSPALLVMSPNILGISLNGTNNLINFGAAHITE